MPSRFDPTNPISTGLTRGDLKLLEDHLNTRGDLSPDLTDVLSKLKLSPFDRFKVRPVIDPGLFNFGDRLVPVVDDPAPAATTTLSSVEQAISQIPIVAEGDAITPDHHNSLRNAIKVLATSSGAAIDQLPVQRFDPQLAAMGGAGVDVVQWGYEYPGVAQTNGNAAGFVRVSLPDGSRLQKVRVRGSRNHMTLNVKVTCHALPTNGKSVTTLATVSSVPPAEPTGDDDFAIEGLLKTPRLPFDRRFRVDLTVVDNDSFLYAISVMATPAGDHPVAVIEAIELEYQPA